MNTPDAPPQLRPQGPSGSGLDPSDRPVVWILANVDTIVRRLKSAIAVRYAEALFVESAPEIDSGHEAAQAAATVAVLATEGLVFVVSCAGDEAICVRCLLRLRATHALHDERLAQTRGLGVNACAPSQLSDFALSAVVGLIDLAARRGHRVDGHGGHALDLRTLDTQRFRCGPATLRANCACTRPYRAAQDLLVDRQKRDATSYRSRKLFEIPIRADAYANRHAGLLGHHVFQEGNQPFYPVSSGKFMDPTAQRDVFVSWFGSSDTRHGSATAAVLEGLERHAGLSCYDDERIRRAVSFRQLGYGAVHPARLGVYEAAYYRNDERVAPFSEDRPLDWAVGTLLGSAQPRYVPADYAYFGHRPQLIYGNSSGSATGSSLEEAVFFGMLETMERDSFIFHWMTRTAPARIAVSSVQDVTCQTLVARLAAVGARVVLLDGRLDLQVPVAFAVILGPAGEYGAFSMAAGAHFEPMEAVRRALSEVSTHYFRFAERSESAARGPLSNALNELQKVTDLEEHALLYGIPQALPMARFLVESPIERSFADTYADWQRSRPRTLSVLDDIGFMQAALHDAGHDEVIWIDQTTTHQAPLGLRTVKTLIPGLLPIDFGHGRCRSTDLPRLRHLLKRLGRRAHALTREELNLAPHPFP